MNKWFAWKEKLGEQIIDLGSPLIKGTKLSLEGKKESANKEISGYMMIQAESMDEAFSLIEESPMSEHVPGSTFEIYECMDMNN